MWERVWFGGGALRLCLVWRGMRLRSGLEGGSDLAVFPTVGTHVPPAADKEGGGVDMFGCPAYRYVEFHDSDDYSAVDHVDG